MEFSCPEVVPFFFSMGILKDLYWWWGASLCGN